MVKPKVALLTAGLGSQNFLQATERLLSASRKLYDFDKCFRLEDQTLMKYCPQISQLYSEYLNNAFPGYGYWIWKPEFIYRIAIGTFGKFDEIVWVDSGCEINANCLSRNIFKHRVNRALEIGFWLHALENSENEYSKKTVKDQFSELSANIMDAPQIQANYMHLSISKSLPLIHEWYKMSIFSIQNFDFQVSDDEHREFVDHRNDQSIFSLLAKKYGVTHSKINLPTGGSRKSVFRGVKEPIWISRNRQGRSRIPAWIKLLP